jgi:hypothetical protein
VGFCGMVGFAFSFMLFIRAIASGISVFEFFATTTESLELCDLCKTFLFAKASGVD